MFKFLKVSSTLALSVITGLMLSNNVLAQGPPSYRMIDQVAIYSDANFRGPVQALREGRYNTHDLSIGNDSLSSLQVPEGWRVILFEDADFQGRSKTFRSTCAFTADFNDLTSSIIVERDAPQQPRYNGGIAIYSDADFRGTFQTLREGRYNIHDLSIGNDSLSSLRVPQGWRVTLYSDADFQGRSKIFRSACAFIADFNDLTSSIIVERDIPRGEVVIYSDAYFKGAVQKLSEGRYNINQLSIGNDSLSSLRIPNGWRVTLYSDADFQGRSKTFTFDRSWVGNDFNDKTSSIYVEYIGFRGR